MFVSAKNKHALAFLRAKQIIWKIEPQTAKTSLAEAQQVIAYILEKHAFHPKGVLLIIYNGTDMRFNIHYHGIRATHDSETARAPEPLKDDVDNEEAAKIVGPSQFPTQLGRRP
ncbi:MAG: hypothetical protein JO110_07540 [Acetobacteraceae bacterium]|nr:hypothetical protein [Acetobacteraceae bacterium]